ncbi:SMI1/KNR4 family protein [Catellatospora vulcania]|uniref:SMI1/KNR4 family protein n=1 Tax=Catellatospora vulcania TaxID=1460450 RepID=UPI0012D3F4C9|nr:SMI1/KNR4 family protein [Catellatospora vulcania]
MAAGEEPRTVEQWRRYLAEYSADVLRVAEDDELGQVSDAQRASRWLGFDGASAAQLAVLEQRLGTALPPSYRSFLAASDGWLNISTFMWTMRTTGDVGWLRDADPDLLGILREHAPPEDASLGDRALLVSGDGDAQYWLLDPGDVSPDGEWAAYIWASWYPGLGERHESFAALVDAERSSFEQLNGRAGRPVDPAGAADLLAAGRSLTLQGDADGAADAFARAADKGSGAGTYLAVMLNAFLDPATVHHQIRNSILAHPHVVEEVGLDQVRAEAVPLFLHRSAIDPYRKLFAGILTEEEMDAADRFTPPPLPEPAGFQDALDRGRRLLRDGLPDQAWTVLEASLPGWHADSPHRIAPVILITDPDLRHLITPERARKILKTPRATRHSVIGARIHPVN